MRVWGIAHISFAARGTTPRNPRMAARSPADSLACAGDGQQPALHPSDAGDSAIGMHDAHDVVVPSSSMDAVTRGQALVCCTMGVPGHPSVSDMTRAMDGILTRLAHVPAQSLSLSSAPATSSSAPNTKDTAGTCGVRVTGSQQAALTQDLTDIVAFGVHAFPRLQADALVGAFRMRQRVLQATPWLGSATASALSSRIRVAVAALSEQFYTMTETTLWFLGRMYTGPRAINLDDFDVAALIHALTKFNLACQGKTPGCDGMEQAFALEHRRVRDTVTAALATYAGRAAVVSEDGYGGWTLRVRGMQAWLALPPKRALVPTGAVLVAAARARRAHKCRKNPLQLM